MKKFLPRFIRIFMVCAVVLVSYRNASASSSVSPLSASKTYYVKPSGKDTNAGTSSAPFKTFSKAVSVLKAGDTLVVSGTFNTMLDLSKSGTASAPITVLGSNAIIDLNNSALNGIRITGNYVNVSGFEVKESKQHAVLINGKYVKFENSNVHHNVLENGSNGNCGLISGWGSGIKISVGGENITISGNTVHENCGEGIAITRGKNIVVENNSVYSNYSVNIYIDNSPYVTAQNNNIYCSNTYLRDGNRATGIAIGEESYSGWGAQRHHNYILNNYIEGCRDGINVWSAEVAGGKFKDSIILGNIIPSGIRRGLSIYSGNQNVLIENNSLFGEIYITYPTGTTLKNNTITSGATSTPTRTPTATTVKSPTPTKTSTLTRTPTITFTPATFTPTITLTPSRTPIVSATATKIPTPTPTDISDIVIDDSDSGFVYSANWREITQTDAYNGAYHYNSKYNSQVTFIFNGESFGIIYPDGPSFRKMEVYVNGVLVHTITRQALAATQQQRWDYPEILPAGEDHIIKLVFPNGNAMLDGIVLRTVGSIPFMKILPTYTATITPTAQIESSPTTNASETPLSLPTATPTSTPPIETATYAASPTPTATSTP